MNRTAIATFGITLALAAIAQPVLAQSSAEAQSDFGPPRPATMQDPALATPAATDAEVGAPMAPAPAAEPTLAPEAPAVIEEVPAARAEEADGYATTRRAAPDREPPRDRHDANPQTGHYLGHGLFNNWGPNDFGA